MNEGYAAWYEGTNAKIDLSKSFEAIHGNVISIFSCNFKGHDFSKQDFSNIKKIIISDSNLSRTKLPIGNIPLYAMSSDLTEIDLSTKEIDAHQYLTSCTNSLTGCCLTNCKVKITLNIEDFKDKEASKSSLKEVMKATNWVGCYVNGKKVLSQKEKKENANKKREELRRMENEIYNSVLGNVKEQVIRMKR